MGDIKGSKNNKIYRLKSTNYDEDEIIDEDKIMGDGIDREPDKGYTLHAFKISLVICAVILTLIYYDPITPLVETKYKDIFEEIIAFAILAFMGRLIYLEIERDIRRLRGNQV